MYDYNAMPAAIAFMVIVFLLELMSRSQGFFTSDAKFAKKKTSDLKITSLLGALFSGIMLYAYPDFFPGIGAIALVFFSIRFLYLWGSDWWNTNNISHKLAARAQEKQKENLARQQLIIDKEQQLIRQRQIEKALKARTEANSAAAASSNRNELVNLVNTLLLYASEIDGSDEDKSILRNMLLATSPLVENDSVFGLLKDNQLVRNELSLVATALSKNGHTASPVYQRIQAAISAAKS